MRCVGFVTRVLLLDRTRHHGELQRHHPLTQVTTKAYRGHFRGAAVYYVLRTVLSASP